MKSKMGFTILELLVVIAIIGILASILFVSINPSERVNSAKETKVVQEMLDIKNAISFYVLDTGRFPAPCRLNCTAATDSLLTAQPGVSGWNGPYLEDGLWSKKHPWGGHMGIFLYDSNFNGKKEVWLILDDDAPGTDASDNTGLIPPDVLLDIDKKVDDNDLNRGAFFLGNSPPFAAGEGAWRVYRVGEES